MFDDHKKLHVILYEFINNSTANNVDFYIARVLLKNLNHLSEMPIKQIAYESNTTVSSVSKFCKKIGYNSYHEMINDNSVYSDAKSSSSFCALYDSIDREITTHIANIQSYMLDQTKYLTADSITMLAKRIAEYRNILLLSSEYNKDVFYLFSAMMEDHLINSELISRENVTDTDDNLFTDYDIILISSLTGKWIYNNLSLVKKYNSKFFVISMHRIPEVSTIYTLKPELILSSSFHSQSYLLTIFFYINYELNKIETAA